MRAPAVLTVERSGSIRERYSRDDLHVFTPEERARFLAGDADPRSDVELAFELLYRLEPDLYDRLSRAERLHPGILDWLPKDAGRVVEVGAGTGRLTLSLLDRCEELVAVEPAAPLRAILEDRIAARGEVARRARVVDGWFDELPVPSGWADLVVACSALTGDPAHGGDAGLTEMERVARPGAMVVVVWPNRLPWLASRGYRHLVFDGPLALEFASVEEAVELARVFHPWAAVEVERRNGRIVPFEVVGMAGPRDLAYRVVP